MCLAWAGIGPILPSSVWFWCPFHECLFNHTSNLMGNSFHYDSIPSYNVAANFAHAMIALLSCHVQRFVAIHPSELGWVQNEICITFELCWKTWWRHQMETFSKLLALCAGNSPVTGEFPAQRPVTWSFDAFFDLCLDVRFSKQWWGLVIWDANALIMTSL